MRPVTELQRAAKPFEVISPYSPSGDQPTAIAELTERELEVMMLLAQGLRQGEIFRKIILKPALRAVFPSLASQFILLTLTTSIATSISAFELTSVAQRIDGDTFRSFEVYFTITAMYLALSWLVMSLFALISRAAFTYPTR